MFKVGMWTVTVLALLSIFSVVDAQGVDPFDAKEAQSKGLPVPSPMDSVDAMRSNYPTLQSDLGLNNDDFRALIPTIHAVALARGVLGPFDRTDYLLGRGYFMNPFQVLEKVPTRKPNSRMPVLQALDNLVETLWDPDAPIPVIKSKEDAYHAAKDKAQANLKVAQAELRAFLTTRQEAVMVLYGFLD